MIKVEGKVKERRPNGDYLVEIDVNGKKAELICYVSGRWKYKYKKVQLLAGDKVLIEISPYDKKRGKIIRKLK